MNHLINKGRAKPIKISKAFDECLSLLLEELRLAIQWNRPCILLAVQPSHAGPNTAALALEKKLKKISQKIVHVNFKDDQFDISILTGLFPPQGDVIFFFSHLSQHHQEDDGMDIYRSLNLYRETFIENQIRAIFWLNTEEAADLPRCAPDFWVFRHRVVEFAPSRRPRLKPAD